MPVNQVHSLFSWFTFYGSHFMVHILWFTFYGSHFKVHILWFTFYGSHFMVHILWFTFYGSHFSREPVNQGSHFTVEPIILPKILRLRFLKTGLNLD
jgi:hypothetical protein